MKYLPTAQLYPVMISGILASWIIASLFPAHAASLPASLILSPPFQEISMGQNDKEKNVVISLTNHTQNDISFQLSIIDFGSLNESGGVAFLGQKGGKELETRYHLSSWIKPEKDLLAVKKNATEQIQLTITNRQALEPGGHYGAVLATVIPEKNTTDSLVTLKQTLSSLIFLKKIGGETYGLLLHDLTITQNPLLFPQNITLRFQNTGNVHVTPHGVISIYNPLGQLTSKSIINEESALIFPETFRKYEIKLVPTIPAYLPGLYRGDIAYRYNTQSDFSHKKFSFVYIPLFIPLLGIIVIGLMLVLISKRKN